MIVDRAKGRQLAVVESFLVAFNVTEERICSPIIIIIIIIKNIFLL